MLIADVRYKDTSGSTNIINTDDLEQPQSKKADYSNFSLFQTATHISVMDCVEITANKPRSVEPAYKTFSINGRF